MYLVRGPKEGYRIGVERGRPSLAESAINQTAAPRRHNNEMRGGRMVGPIPSEEINELGIQSNRMGVIPKGQSGKWRLITDLSYPQGHRPVRQVAADY